MSEKIHFTKMHGLGNDYIYVNATEREIASPAALAIRWSDRHTGIGSDGLVLIGKSSIADFSMRIFNADGSEAMMCGNASRCIGRYVYEYGLTSKTDITLETLSGIKRIHLNINNSEIESITVDMGEPALANREQVNSEDGSLHEYSIFINNYKFKGTYICMGNPHFVIFVNDVETIPLDEVGPILESHPIFPQKSNIEFATLTSDGKIRMRVWERGSGITQACGTGACATMVAARCTNRTGREADICMDGGTLHVRWDETDGHIYMTGPAVRVFDGTIEI